MCLVGIAFRVIPGCPALVFANREEAYSRPATQPQIQIGENDAANWVGGVDLLAGGTWLAVNEHGLLVAVTNRSRRNVPESPRSRGLLCRELAGLASVGTAEAEALRQLREFPFAGCNVILLDRDLGVVIEAGDMVVTKPLDRGLQLITNGNLNAEYDPRIQRVRAELDAASLGTVQDWIAATIRLCGETGDGVLPPVCLEGHDRGTVSSTIIALTEDIATCGYWHAAGPPSRTGYGELSLLLREVLRKDSPQRHGDTEKKKYS